MHNLSATTDFLFISNITLSLSPSLSFWRVSSLLYKGEEFLQLDTKHNWKREAWPVLSHTAARDCVSTAVFADSLDSLSTRRSRGDFARIRMRGSRPSAWKSSEARAKHDFHRITQNAARLGRDPRGNAKQWSRNANAGLIRGRREEKCAPVSQPEKEKGNLRVQLQREDILWRRSSLAFANPVC